jgi:hypothetical protein
MACPFFLPIEKLENGAWLHPHRLPLGCGWSGHCGAPGHEGESPSQEDLQDFCNLGYAEACARLPQERPWDSVRFTARSVFNHAENGRGQRIQLRYVCERGHRPAEHGFLEFDIAQDQWVKYHGNASVQKMAECFLAAYFDKIKKEAEPVAS